MTRAWRPPYETLLRIAQILSHGNTTVDSIHQLVPAMPRHHVQLSLQELVRRECATMLRKGVPGKGFIGWYRFKCYPIQLADKIKRKKTLDDDEILQVPKEFVAPAAPRCDALSEVWPIPAPPLPDGEGRVVRAGVVRAARK